MSWSYPSGFDASTALLYAGYCQQAYFQYYNLQDPPTPTPFGFPPYSQVLSWPPAGYETICNIYSNETLIDDDADNPFIGFVIQNTASPADAVFVVRGTETAEEWIDDLLFSSQKSCPVTGTSGSTHEGFNLLYTGLYYGSSPGGTQQTLAEVVSANGITSAAVTGHSLGGALATLLALDLALNNSVSVSPIYTFASPVVGDPTFASFYNSTFPSNSFQVVNGFDQVPNLPPSVFYYPTELSDLGFGTAGEYDYQQVGGYCPIDGGATPFEDIAHSLTSYAAGLNALLSGGTGTAARSVAARRHRRGYRAPVATPELVHA